MTTSAKVKIMLAFCGGQTIEVKAVNDWNDVNIADSELTWNWAAVDYRIKEIKG